MKRARPFTSALLCTLLLLPLLACTPEGPKVELTVEFAAPPGTPDLGTVEVFVGTDHLQTGSLRAGTQRTLNVYPGSSSTDPTFGIWLLIYPQGQRPGHWQSESLARDKSHKFHVTINQASSVISARSCVVPCQL